MGLHGLFCRLGGPCSALSALSALRRHVRVWLRTVVDGVEGDSVGGDSVGGVDGARCVYGASCGDRGWLGFESPTVLVRGLSDSVKN